MITRKSMILLTACIFFSLIPSGRADDVFQSCPPVSKPGSSFSQKVLSVQYEGKKEAPRIYIYHTHTYEAYSMEDGNIYTPTESWRTKDNDFNIVAVGNALREKLVLAGFQVYHDTAAYEPPRLSSAYSRSLKGLEKTLSDPYDLYLDLHRDAFCKGNGPNTVIKNHVTYARLLILVGQGTGQNELYEKPDWKANEKIALHLSDFLNRDTENLCRGVSLKSGRYNQHIAPQCLLIEIGNNKNTLTEALHTADPLAKAICHYFDEIN